MDNPVRYNETARRMKQETTTITNPKILWPLPPASLSLCAGEVHVWAASLAQSTKHILRASKSLSQDELDRAGRYHFDADRRRFIVGRGTLREILGSYAGREPDQLKFDYSARGKPALSGCEGEQTVHFNVAHSDELMLVAVTKICALGVDVERVRPLSDSEGVAERFFSAHESSGLKALAGAEKQAAFFNLWTRKEAWLKATGEGIGESLNQVQVSFLTNEPARLISLFGDSQAGRNWFLCELNPAEEFAGALAVAAPSVEVKCWHWRG